MAIPRTPDQSLTSLAEFDCHSPLMSVPGVLEATLETLPVELPYLFPRPSTVDHWERTITGLSPDRDRRRIGLTWAGNPRHPNDARRSIPFSCLVPLLESAA